MKTYRVYFLDVGTAIRIGWTANLYQQFRCGDNLLGVITCIDKVHAVLLSERLQREFEKHRTKGGVFRKSDELLDYIRCHSLPAKSVSRILEEDKQAYHQYMRDRYLKNPEFRKHLADKFKHLLTILTEVSA